MLKIVDRTKPRTTRPAPIAQKHVVQEPVVVAPQVPIVDQYKAMAEALRRRKPQLTANVPSITNHVVETPIVEHRTIADVAQEIKDRRLSIKPATDAKFGKVPSFKYTRKDGTVAEAVPTAHAISQFNWRYTIIRSSWVMLDNVNEIVESMKREFSIGRRTSDKKYEYRNHKRKSPVSVIFWGTRSGIFVIDPVTNTIITFELNGIYKKFNHLKTAVLEGTLEVDVKQKTPSSYCMLMGREEDYDSDAR